MVPLVMTTPREENPNFEEFAMVPLVMTTTREENPNCEEFAMVPLVMTTPREENPNFEEFATHLSLYDDSFSMVEKSIPAVTDTKGPVPPSVLCPVSKNCVDITGQFKVKRKCGRPRNPIPRHKRESHINAEHRRRGKIQDGFRTLKNIVPKFEQTSGRDSKADILFKAVDYSKLLQNDINELCRSLEALRAERDLLAVDIKNYQSLVPDVCPYTDVPVSMDDRYEDYVQQKSSESWAFGTFKAMMHPLFESYKLSVQGESMSEFLCSVADWAARCLSMSSLRAVCITALRETCKQGLGVTDQYTEDATPDNNSNYRSAGCMGHSQSSDRNNNNDNSNTSQCFNNQAFTSEQFSCREGASCGSSGGGGLGTASLEMYVNAFNNSHAPEMNSSPTSKHGANLSLQPRQDLAPFSGNTAASSINGAHIFSDLYYNLDHNTHQLNLAKANIDGSDHWPQFYLRQQHWPPYQNSNLSAPSYLHNFKRNNQFWRSPPSVVSGHALEDLPPFAPHFYDKTHHFSDRDFRDGLSTSREAPDMLSPPCVSFLGQPAHFPDHEQGRHKSSSQSSSEGEEGSLLNTDAIVKQVSDTVGHNDKYGQLSPSPDSGISPGSSMCVSSPSVLNGRSADYAFPYPSTSTLDHFKLHKHFSLDRADNLDNQLSMTLPSYKDTFGGRQIESLRHSVTRNDGVRALWGPSSIADTRGASPKQTLPERHESSTLLAQMLGQASSMSPSHHALTTGSSVTSPPSSFVAPNSSSHFLPVNALTATKVMTHFPNGFPAQVKQESGCRHSSMEDHSRDLPPSSLRESQHDVHFNFQTSSSQTNYFPWQSSSDENNHKAHPSNWLQHFHHNPSVLDPQRSAVLGDSNEARDQICFFEMAHQQLLKHQGLSQNRIYELKTQDFGRSLAQAHLLTSNHKADTLYYKTDLTENVQTLSPPGVRQTRSVIEQTGQLAAPLHLCQVSKDALLNQKGRRKSPMEAEDPGDHLMQSVSSCKRTCSWQQRDSPYQDHPAKGRPSSAGSVQGTA